MSVTVVEFKQNIESGEGVIAMLEDMLQSAKDGLVINFFGVTLMRDNTASGGWANAAQPFTMLGCIEAMKNDFMQATIEH